MKYVITALLLILTSHANCQSKPYKDYDVCIDSATYKGKKNHGKYYCTSSMRVREYKNGKKDTLEFFLGGSTLFFSEKEYSDYQALPERGKYIIDSLKEDGISRFNEVQLSYEAMYMKQGQQIKDYWDTQGNDVIMLRYKIHNNKSGQGYELIKKIKCK